MPDSTPDSRAPKLRLDEAGLAFLLDRLADRVAQTPIGARCVIGIVGAPGSGKSTLASLLADRWNARHAAPLRAAVVPMDGFHFTNAKLIELGLRSEKGSPRTFDARALSDLLARARRGEEVLFPVYDRALHEPVLRDEASHRLTGDHRLVLTEGNYLLQPTGDWPRVKAVLDEAWFLATDEAVARQWILARHQRGGRSPAEAESHYERVDLPNARLIRAHTDAARLHLFWPPVG